MPKTQPYETVTLRYKDVPAFLNHLQKTLRQHGYSPADLYAIRLACTEALANAHKHGNGTDTRKTINIQYRVDRREFSVRIEDRGKGFNPQTVPDPTAPENMEKPDGRGLLLMRTRMDNVKFSKKGNVVNMRRSRRIDIP